MKKIIALALSLILVLSLSVIASAETANYGDSSEIPTVNPLTVSGTYVGDADGAPKMYVVQVDWEGLSFTYTDVNKVWDPEDHVEIDDPNAEAEWTGEGTITVINHSNAGLTAAATYTRPENATADIVLDKDSFNLVAAAGENVDSNVFTVTPKEGSTLAASGDIATITITLSAWNGSTGE